MFDIILKNLIGYDMIILILGAGNVLLYLYCRKMADTIYNHFNHMDRISNHSEEQIQRLEDSTESNQKLSTEVLLDTRVKMMRTYAAFTNFTTIFPLLGMLGTVISLIPMVNMIGSEVTSSFFGALTSTFWGIVCAILCKVLDATISYKIDDNETYMDYLFNPKPHQ